MGMLPSTNTTSNFYGSSFTLDGSGDYISSPYNADFNFGAGDFTVEAWINTTQSGAYATTVGRWTSSAGYWGI